MRYESFYPFSQNRANNFFNFNSPPPANSPTPTQNAFGFGMPANQPGTQPNNFLQGVLGSLQQRGSGGPGGFGGRGNLGGQGGFPQGPPGNRTTSYLQTADKFLSTAQQLTPMVRQYAPMLQNVPALWRLYRGIQSAPNATATATNVSAASAPSVAGAARAATSATTNANTTGASLPRIFQPPI
ncbi:VrrA/YqfQ family protein [Psychrobacillus sp. FJAT-51614]|uniref:VrrA/YqfQ family protein n=1 Tax=Psychrobacillus mangrovi TaxID=3117745 RepID=A0ABU8F7A2_9BACI